MLQELGTREIHLYTTSLRRFPTLTIFFLLAVSITHFRKAYLDELEKLRSHVYSLAQPKSMFGSMINGAGKWHFQFFVSVGCSRFFFLSQY
jgi:hypothetical protein